MNIDKKIDASTNLTFLVSDICQPILKDIQSAKILLLPTKYEIIMLASNY